MSDLENRSILERLEEEFESQKAEQIKEPDKQPEKKTTASIKRMGQGAFKIRRKAVLVTAAILVLVFAAGLAIWAKQTSVPNTDDVRATVPDFLTKEEKDDWENKEVDQNEIYVIVNANLDVQGDNSVQLRLANPPYCAYPLKVSICDTENAETVYYESPVLNPGDSIEKAELTKLPGKAGTYSVAIQYQFFADKGDDSVVGEHTVNAELIIH